MLNIPDLEKRWLHYKIKFLLPYAIIIFSMLVITVILLNFIGEKQVQKADDKMQFLDVKQPVTLSALANEEVLVNDVKKNIVTIEQKNEPTIVKNKSELLIQNPVSNIPTHTKSVLKPSLSFMKEMQNSTQPYYENEPSHNEVSNSNDVEHEPLTQKEKVKEEKKEETVQTETIDEPAKINIKRQNTQNDLQEIIKRFKKNKNPALSLFVAKKYYELGDYHQSYNYALITNSINRDIESSWIIFSKSLVKLGQKDLAEQTLQEYIKQSHSEGAKLLLNEITSGKFK